MATSFDREISLRGRVGARPLTDAAIRSLRPGESRTDGALPIGNGRLVVSCSKARGQLRRVWTFRYRKADLRGEAKIGEYPALTLLQARQEARGLLELVRQGSDPKVAQAEARLANLEAARQTAALGSFQALLDAYVAHLERAGKASASDVAGIFKRHVTDPWPDLVKLPANRIAPEAVRDILARMVRKDIFRQTNIVRSYLHAAFTHGAHSDLDPRRAAIDEAVFKLASNPVALLPRIKDFESARDRILSDVEFRHLWRELNDVRLEIALAIRCQILLGGQRFLQLLRATWGDYDLERQVLRLADPKGKRAHALSHLLPVPTRVAGFLRELRSLNGHGDFIFSTTAGLKPIHHTNLPPVFSAIAKSTPGGGRKQAGAFQGRDIRRSIETRLQALGVSREVRAQVLSHGRSGGVQQKHYERYDYLREKAEALALLDRHLAMVFENVKPRSIPGSRATRGIALDADMPSRNHPCRWPSP
jgi:integrase